MYYSSALKDMYEEEKKYLEQQLEECRKKDRILPGKNLRLHMRKPRPAFAVTDDTDRDLKGALREHYLPEKDPAFYRLAAKYCAARLQSVIETELGHLLRNPGLYHPERLEEEKCRLEDFFGERVPKTFWSIRKKAFIWAAENYHGNDGYPEEKIIPTLKGDLVRSKIEEIVANLLYEWDIPYRYENPVELSKKKTLYPDFTIMSPYTGKIFYLEVCGMMDKENYAARTAKRLKELAEADIYFGKNLLLVMDMKTEPFDPVLFRKMLEENLRK